MSGTTAGLDGTSLRFDRILFATDFSRASATALPYVAAIACRFGSELCVAHVISPRAYAGIPSTKRPAMLSQLQGELESGIKAALASAHLTDIRHQALLEVGDIWPALSSLADHYKIDLIAAGTHGAHGLEKLVSGSTAEEILNLAARPVLLVGPEVRILPQRGMRLERILYVTNFSPEEKAAMEFAYAITRAYSAHLLILHVIDNPLDEPRAARMSGDAFCRLRLFENGWSEREKEVEPEFLLEFGSREGRTLEIMDKRDVQLLVVGVPSSSRLLSAHLPGPLAYNLVTHACCPVLSVRGEESF